jgi:hypothetical protein
VQRHGQPLVLDQGGVRQLGLGAFCQVGHRGHPGQRGGLGDHLAVVPDLEAVQAVQVHPGEGLEPGPQEAHRARRDDRHPGHDGGEFLEHMQHGRHRLGRVGVVGDGGQHTVEVEEERGVAGTLGGEAPRLGRIRRMGGSRCLSHDLQTTRSDGHFPYAKFFSVPVRRDARLCTTAYGS